MRVTVVGPGAVGRRVAEELSACAEVTVVARPGRPPGPLPGPAPGAPGAPGPLPGPAPRVVARLEEALPADVVVLTVAEGARRAAIAAIDNGSHLVAPLDDPADVSALLALDARARARGVTVALGTAMAPGLSCMLASCLAGQFDRVEEIHVASFGTGGPACARRHHAALTGVSVDWVDGGWRRRPGGSGRELVWFPEPVGGADCYRAAVPEPLLLQPRFPGCRRITARMAATRRDRLTSWLPMMRPPHPEGLVGAVRVELRGWIGSEAATRVLGVASPPAVAAAAVASAAARWATSGRLGRAGAAGLAELVAEPGLFLRETGLPVAAFLGAEDAW